VFASLVYLCVAGGLDKKKAAQGRTYAGADKMVYTVEIILGSSSRQEHNRSLFLLNLSTFEGYFKSAEGGAGTKRRK
jgi:hypothetical protein